MIFRAWVTRSGPKSTEVRTTWQRVKVGMTSSFLRPGWRKYNLALLSRPGRSGPLKDKNPARLNHTNFMACDYNIELWLRDLKITMDMDRLRTKTPARARAELAMFLVGYNLIRTVMFDAAKMSEVRLEQVSFKSALMRFGLWYAGLRGSIRIRVWLLGYQAMLKDLGRDLNPDRPGRYEPRVVKRRPKPFPRMQQPRQVLRQQLVRA